MQVARILLFIYLFYHIYLHYDQVLNIFVTLPENDIAFINIYPTIIVVLTHLSDRADAHLWLHLSICGARNIGSHEHYVVWENIEGAQETIGKEAVRNGVM